MPIDPKAWCENFFKLSLGDAAGTLAEDPSSLATIKAEWSRLRVENERLRAALDKVTREPGIDSPEWRDQLRIIVGD